MDKYSWQAIKHRGWYGSYNIQNNFVKKKIIEKVNRDVKYKTFFLHRYVDSYSSNVDLSYIASNEMDSRTFLSLCKYLYDKDKYVAKIQTLFT